MALLLIHTVKGSWSIFILIPLVFAGFAGSLWMIASGLRGLVIRRDSSATVRSEAPRAAGILRI